MLATINNWPLSRKMLVAFTLIAILFVAVAATGIVTNDQLKAVAGRHITRGLGGMKAIATVRSTLQEQRILTFALHNAVDQADAGELSERLQDSQAALVEAVATFRRVAGAGFEAEVTSLSAAVAGMNNVTSRMVAERSAGNELPMTVVNGAAKDVYDLAMAETETLVLMTIERADVANRDGESLARTALTIAMLLSGTAMIALTGIWFAIARTVAAPMAALAQTTTERAAGVEVKLPSLNRGDELGQIARAVQSFSETASHRAEADAVAAAEQAHATLALGESLRAMSEGDLTRDVKAEFAPAYQALKTDLNQALASLSGLMGSVSNGVAAIRTGSAEIAQASEDLARRTEGNAASLEQTSAALVQIETRLHATAASAKNTVVRADQAIASVDTGRTTAESAMQAMTRVSISAKGIDSVIEGVDKIAFQTRVLAMNAAVEAGRAGDAGRGFAVVADLVSALAMRAEEEAKQARDQLTVTQAEIVTAVDAVQKVDGALLDISGDVDAVHQLVASMADDNLAQSAAITEISSAVGSMDKATQQNAAMVEETSAAARNLTVEIEALSDQARQFRTDAGGTAGVAAATQRVAAGMGLKPALRSVPASTRRAANAPPKARVSAHAAADASDWADF